jgi:hypothetical protein
MQDNRKSPGPADGASSPVSRAIFHIRIRSPSDVWKLPSVMSATSRSPCAIRSCTIPVFRNRTSRHRCRQPDSDPEPSGWPVDLVERDQADRHQQRNGQPSAAGPARSGASKSEGQARQTQECARATAGPQEGTEPAPKRSRVRDPRCRTGSSVVTPRPAPRCRSGR